MEIYMQYNYNYNFQRKKAMYLRNIVFAHSAYRHVLITARKEFEIL